MAADAHELALLHLWIEVGRGEFGVGHAEELEKNGQHLAVGVVEGEEAPGDFLPRVIIRVPLGDAVEVRKTCRIGWRGTFLP